MKNKKPKNYKDVIADFSADEFITEKKEKISKSNSKYKSTEEIPKEKSKKKK